MSIQLTIEKEKQNLLEELKIQQEKIDSILERIHWIDSMLLEAKSAEKEVRDIIETRKREGTIGKKPDPNSMQSKIKREAVKIMKLNNSYSAKFISDKLGYNYSNVYHALKSSKDLFAKTVDSEGKVKWTTLESAKEKYKENSISD